MNRAKQGKPRALDWSLDLGLEYAPAKFVLIIMARRGNSSHLCFMTHNRIKTETGLSLSTVGRSIRYLKKTGVIRQVPSTPLRRAAGIQTYELLVDALATGHGDVPHKSQRPLPAGQADRQNPNESKKNLRTAPPARVSRKGQEAIQIGELIKRGGHSFEQKGMSRPTSSSTHPPLQRDDHEDAEGQDLPT